jgi:hypothetical protein
MHLARRIIWSTLVVLALAPAAAQASGSGSTAQRHQMSMYKVEYDMSLDAVDVGTTSLYCNGKDLALDGMWRVTYTDYEPELEDEPTPPGGWNDYNGIQVWDSHSTTESSWRFTIYNETSETAQVKLWITCINYKVQPADRDAHKHHLNLGPLKTANHTFSGTTPVSVKAGNFNCPSDTIAVAPGYEVTQGSLRAYKSVPFNAAISAWTWGFYQQGTTKVTTSIRCLDLASSTDATPSHFHRLVVTARDQTISLPPGIVSEVKADCSSLEKAMVGIFDVKLGNAWTSPFSGHFLWYLGMEPQIKSRVFKVWNVDAATPWTGRFGAVCFNDRIGRRVLA